MATPVCGLEFIVLTDHPSFIRCVLFHHVIGLSLIVVILSWCVILRWISIFMNIQRKLIDRNRFDFMNKKNIKQVRDERNIQISFLLA
ncbi:hypothetical protein Hanom_Chr04g00302651 [Helianthus anomalus]